MGYDPAGLADNAQTKKFQIEHGRVMMMAAAGGMSAFGLPQHESPQKATEKTHFSPAVAAAAAIPTLLSNVLPALAEEIDSSEAYNRKVMTGAAYCLTLSFSFWESLFHRHGACGKQVAKLSSKEPGELNEVSTSRFGPMV